MPYSQFLHLRRICFKDNDFVTKSKEMASFFERRWYPCSVITTSRKWAQWISCERALRNSEWHNRTEHSEKGPQVLTYHLKNQEVKKILLKKCWRNWTKACGPFRWAPSFTGGVQHNHTCLWKFGQSYAYECVSWLHLEWKISLCSNSFLFLLLQSICFSLNN